MVPSISLVTLGVADVARSVRFYEGGFGWTAAFTSEQIAFFQMNGFVLALYARDALAEDSARADMPTPGAFSLAHNVERLDAVVPAMERLIAAGATLLREASRPPHGGFRGYVADPDGHAWEIAWHPAFEISPEGHVRLTW
jgi:hypothetical protein